MASTNTSPADYNGAYTNLTEESIHERARCPLSKDAEDNAESNEETTAQMLMMSPNAMAEAAFAAGVEHRKKRDADRMTQSDSINDDSRSGCTDSAESSHGFGIERDSTAIDPSSNLKNKRRRLSAADLDTMVAKTRRMQSDQTQIHGLENNLDDIWVALEPSNDDGADIDGADIVEKSEAALGQTKDLVFSQLDSIIRAGLDAFHQNEEISRELVQMKELSDSRGREVQRLKASEEDSRASLSVSASH